MAASGLGRGSTRFVIETPGERHGAPSSAMIAVMIWHHAMHSPHPCTPWLSLSASHAPRSPIDHLQLHWTRARSSRTDIAREFYSSSRSRDHEGPIFQDVPGCGGHDSSRRLVDASRAVVRVANRREVWLEEKGREVGEGPKRKEL